MLLIPAILLVLVEGSVSKSGQRLQTPSFISSSNGNNLQHRPFRTLEQDNNNYNSYSWLLDYSIKFNSCHTVTEYDIDEDGYGILWVQRLVKFKLCSVEQCDWNCKGGRYLVKMEDFVLAYADRMEADEEYACQNALDECGCGGDDDYDDGDDDCEYNCFVDASLDNCLDNDANDDDDVQFDIRDYAECKALNMDDDGQQYYMGLKCSNDGQGINLGIFTDAECMVEKGDDDEYESQSFPYQDESFVTSNCVTCAGSQFNGDNQEGENDQYYNDDDGSKLSDVCTINYDESAKCETNMNIDNPDYDACDLIDNIPLGVRQSRTKSTAAAVLVAMVFFLSSAFLALTAMYLVRSANSRQIDLLENDITPEVVPGSSIRRKKSFKKRVATLFNK